MSQGVVFLGEVGFEH